MDSIKQILAQFDKIRSQTAHIKIDDPDLKRLHDETMQEVEEQRKKLEKTIKDADNIK